VHLVVVKVSFVDRTINLIEDTVALSFPVYSLTFERTTHFTNLCAPVPFPHVCVAFYMFDNAITFLQIVGPDTHANESIRTD